jgi:hypothetical protein
VPTFVPTHVTAHPELLAALRSGEIRIHRAWKWSKLPAEEQLNAFMASQSQRGPQGTMEWMLVEGDSWWHVEEKTCTACGIGGNSKASGVRPDIDPRKFRNVFETNKDF